MKKNFWLVGILLAVVLGGLEAWLKTPSSLEFHVLDVGQGDAILLRTSGGENVLIDGGPDAKVLEELGEVLSPLDKKLDLVVMTHPDADHVAGLVPVLQRFEVEQVLMSAPAHDTEVYNAFLKEVSRQNIPYTFADQDTDFSFEELHLDVLWPFEAVTGQAVKATNNQAIVIRATSGEHSFLLTADIEAEVEEALLAADVYMEADILKAGHHGSHTSSTPDFLKAVGAEDFLISCAEGNDYGHPHSEVLQNAEDADMNIFRTDLDGRISVFFNKDSYEIKTRK